MRTASEAAATSARETGVADGIRTHDNRNHKTPGHFQVIDFNSAQRMKKKQKRA
jgi:hypothetical protein